MVTSSQFSPEPLRGPLTVTNPTTSTPLDDGTTDGGVPTALLWALKEHRRVHLDLHHENVFGVRLGEGDSAVWVIDTDHGHCTIGRLVGKSPEGVTYCLVATITSDTYEEYAANLSDVASIFSHAHNLYLCGVWVDNVSNVMDVRRYAHADDVPADFLPPHPFTDFPEPIEPELF